MYLDICVAKMTCLHFTEYDAFAEAIREASMTMRLCSLELSQWTLQYVDTGNIRLQHGFEGGGSIAEGATFTEGWTFYHQIHPVHANGQIATKNAVFAAPPGGEFCLACKPLHDWVTVFVPTSLLFSTPIELEFAAKAKPMLLKPPAPVVGRFASLVRRFLVATEKRPQLVATHAALEGFEDELIEATKELFIHTPLAANRNFERWYRYAKSTIDKATLFPEVTVSVAELARQNQVPERTLRTAFQKCFGVSPIEYLRIYRLHLARHLLAASHPEATTVTKVAFGLGFWDMGRFASNYRRLFGELPSTTLRRSPSIHGT